MTHRNVVPEASLDRLRRGAARAARHVAPILLLAALGIGTPQVHAAQDRLQVDEYSDQYDELFRHYTRRYFGPFVDWRWFKAVAVVESLLDERARSENGARGLMQLLPATFAAIRDKQPHLGDIENPRWNIAAGIYYIREMYGKWPQGTPDEERLLLSLASYNAGYGRVRDGHQRSSRKKGSRWKDVKAATPLATRAYVERIRSLMASRESAEPIRLGDAGDWSSRLD